MTCEFDPTHEVGPQGCRSTRFYDPIRVPRQDEEGYPVYSQITGELQYVLIPLARPIAAHSRLEPSGLVEAICAHGLTETVTTAINPNNGEQIVTHHSALPDGRRLRAGNSWVRSKYLDSDGSCPACHGQPIPDDMTTPRLS